MVDHEAAAVCNCIKQGDKKMRTVLIVAVATIVMSSPALTADMPGASRGYAPNSPYCNTTAPVFVEDIGANQTVIENLANSILEVKYTQLNGAGAPFTSRYLHLTKGERRTILNVGFSECVTDAKTSWSKGPSAAGKFDVLKSGGTWRIRNKTNHYVAIVARATSQGNVVGIPNGTIVTITAVISPGKTSSIWAMDTDPLTVVSSFEDVFPYSEKH